MMRLIVLPLLISVVLSVTAVGSDAPDRKMPDADCRTCHSCSTPTRESPCLNPCPRATAQPAQSTDEELNGVPVTIQLDYMDSLYQPVTYDHKLHAGMPDTSCTACHHHSIKSPFPACISCHPISGTDAETGLINLKGAFHRQCLNCHRELTSDSSCTVCHAVKSSDATVPPSPATKLPLTPIPHFNHSSTRFPLKAYHQTVACIQCHRKAVNHHTIPTTCEACHTKWPPEFRHELTGLKLDDIHTAFQCADCHNQDNMAANPTCEACHDPSFQYPHKIPGVKSSLSIADQSVR